MKRTASYGSLALICMLWLTSCTSMVHTVPTNASVMTLIATSGTGQSHAVNGAFGSPLVATVMTDGAPTSGVVVTFTDPASGASATFSDTTSRTATTTT